jgi:DNA-binding LytR/AlgR family response regulator
MYKLCLNSRDELLIINLDNLAYLRANGNYTQLKYIGGEERLLTMGISKIEDFIRQTWPKDRRSPFIRLGRSLIINQRYLSGISILKQKVILSDNAGRQYALTVPKPLIKEYKERINELYSTRTEVETE